MRKSILLFMLLFTILYAAVAQEVQVAGRVTDANGQPIPSASITIKGKQGGTTSRPDGSFTINASKGDVIRISGIGFDAMERTVNGEALSITLSRSNSDLEDVIVVGYGTQKKANLTGSVTTLKNESLTKRQVATTSNLLQGLATGVTVQQQSGKPGSDGASIRIRGISSVLAGNSPLILVDGVVSSMDAVDPNAIETITVLKDAASTAVYGSRAANGVILVKTKRGAGKGLQVSYNNFFSKQVATAMPERVSAIEHMELSNLAEQNRTGDPSKFIYTQDLINKYKTTAPNNLDVIDTDWTDLLFTNSGLMQNHNLTLTAGGERVNLFTSVTYLKQEGIIQNNSFEKYDIRFNPDFKISDKLTLSGVFNYNNNTRINPSTGSAEFIIRQGIGLPAIGAGKFGEGMYGTAGQTNNRNPLAMAEATGTSTVVTNSFLSKVALVFKPIKNLEVEAFWAREHWTPHSKTWIKNADIYVPNLDTKSYDKVSTWPGSTSLGEAYSSNTRKTYLAQATYAASIGEHSFKMLAGGQTEEFVYAGIGASRTGFINPDQPYLGLGSGNINNSGSATEFALAGFFGRLNYNYAEKYLLELNGRYDGSSRFYQPLDNQWGFFPSASAGWVISKENFWDGISDKIGFAKLRGSIGTLGNQELSSNYPFAANYEQANYSNPNNGTNAYFNFLNTLGYQILEAANPNITWETSKQWNLGVDLSFLKYFNLTADYYVRSIEDLILLKPIPSYVQLNSPYVNIGSMENRGWEVALNYKRKFNKLGVDVTGMLSDVKNKMTSLPGIPYLDYGSRRSAEGYAHDSYFGYQALGYFQDTTEIKNSPVQFGIPYNSSATVGPKPGDVKYADISGPDGKPDGKVDANDRTFIGNNFPRYEYSINLNLTYGNFDFNLFGQGVGKRDNYLSGTGAIPFNSADFVASLLDIHKDYWTPSNPNASFPRLLPAGQGGNNYLASNHWIRSASYFRIKNIALGYTLPAVVTNMAKIRSARIYVSASNLVTFSSTWKGFDPEINNANGEFYPLMKTFTAGLNVNF